MQPTKRSRFGEANLILLFLFFYFSQTCIIFKFNEILEMKPFVTDNETKIRSLLLRLMLLYYCLHHRMQITGRADCSEDRCCVHSSTP